MAVKTIWSPDHRAGFWKPVEVGESIQGKVVGVKRIRFNQVLKLFSDRGLILIPLTQFLKDFPFSEVEGQLIRIVYLGEEEAKGGKMKIFQVDLIEPDDEVPF